MYMHDSEHQAANRTISQLGVQLDSDRLALMQEELDGFNIHLQMLSFAIVQQSCTVFI